MEDIIFYKQHKKALYFWALVIVSFSFFVGYFFLHLDTRWWFEDDPMVVSHAAEVQNPLTAFTDPKVARDYGAGNALAPVQVVSYWIDWKIAGPNAAFFYFHDVLSSSLVAGLVFLVLALFIHNIPVAVGLAAMWVLLPSTLVLEQFIAARHYIEGALFFLMGVYLILLGKDRTTWGLVATIVILGLGMLTKETWAVTTLTFLFLWGICKGRRVWTIGSLVMAFTYFVYRLYLVGGNLSYQARQATLFDYWQFIGSLPYVVTANRGGYILLLAAVFSLGWILRSESSVRTHFSSKLIFIVILVLPSVVALYPVSYSLLVTYIAPNTWYRVFSILALGMIFILGLLLTAALPKRYKLALCAILFTSVLYGAKKTRQWWMDRSTALAVEGKFFLENPDKMLYSEDEAFWFLPGISRLYHGNENQPFLNPYHQNFARFVTELKENKSEYQTVYIREGTTIVPSTERYTYLLGESAPHE